MNKDNLLDEILPNGVRMRDARHSDLKHAARYYEELAAATPPTVEDIRRIQEARSKRDAARSKSGRTAN